MSAVSRPARGIRAFDGAAVAVMLFGWLVPGVGLILGLVMLWRSRTWSVREKALGTLTPVASSLAAAIVFLPGHDTSHAVAYVVLVMALLVAIAGAAFLADRARAR